MQHLHGFHSYAARMHPQTAERLIEELSRGDQTVLDPFCGSGTVVVAARLLGRRAIGRDANPLAVRIASLKTRPGNARFRKHLVEAAHRASDHADARRKSKAGSTRRYGKADRDEFEPHVLLELDGLRQGIQKLPERDRDPLLLVLSSILTKVSRRPGDTADNLRPRRLASGFTIRTFARKAEELAQRFEEAEHRAAKRPFPAKIAVGDARTLHRIAPRSVDLVVTSPPYPGVYDYARQHSTRARWLGIDDRSFVEREIGARRNYDKLGYDRALRRWGEELGDALAAMERVIRSKGRIALVIGDSVVERRAVYADQVISSLAPAAKLRVVATASQVRPHFHGPSARAFRGRPRREHVIVLGRGGTKEA